jgi:hypothetical protein
MELSSSERALIMSAIESKWWRLGLTAQEMADAYNIWLRIGVTISVDFRDAMREAGHGTD